MNISHIIRIQVKIMVNQLLQKMIYYNELNSKVGLFGCFYAVEKNHKTCVYWFSHT